MGERQSRHRADQEPVRDKVPGSGFAGVPAARDGDSSTRETATGKAADFAARRARSLAGPIRTAAPWGSFDADWHQINRWDDEIRAAAAEFGVAFERIKAHIVIESQGNAGAVQHNLSNGPSYGLMQVVPFGVGWDGWHRDVFRLAGVGHGDAARMLLDDPGLNVRVGTFILKVQHDNHRDWDKASSSFFLGNPDWIGSDGVNGTQGREYQRALRGLIEELAGADLASEFETGDRIRVTDGDPPLNLRPSPGTSGAPLRTLSTGAELCVLGGPVEAGGHEWYEVELPAGRRGWVAGRFCGLVAKGGCQPE